MNTLQQLYGALDGPPADPVFITPLQDVGVVASYPFDCKLVGSSLTVRYGTINGLAPDNINSTFATGGAPNFYVLLSVVTSNAQVVSSTIVVSATPAGVMPVQIGQPPATFSTPIAVCSSSKLFRAIGNGSLVATPYEVYRLAKSTPTPDALPFDSYYSWRLGLA